MTIEQVKEEAKKRFGRELTDEQAQEWLDGHGAAELSAEELDSVAGGGCMNEETMRISCPDHNCGCTWVIYSYSKSDLQMCPRCGRTFHIPMVDEAENIF